jgi:hypothetical protein
VTGSPTHYLHILAIPKPVTVAARSKA